MAGYVHVCEQCGSQMQVHERYVGRTLKCTSCRTEFTAEMPPEGAPEPPAAVEAPVVEEQKRANLWLVAIVLLIPLAGFIWWLGQDQSEGPASAVFGDRKAVGELAALRVAGDQPVLVALDQQSVGALVDMRDGAVQIGVGSLMKDDGRFLTVSPGTRVRVLEYANGDREARIRIVEGEWVSRIVWVPARWVK